MDPSTKRGGPGSPPQRYATVLYNNAEGHTPLLGASAARCALSNRAISVAKQVRMSDIQGLHAVAVQLLVT